MKTSVLYFFILCFTISAIPLSAQDKLDDICLSDELTIQNLDADVYLITHRFPWAANSLLVRVSSKDFILVDTPWENQATAILHQWIQKTFGDVDLKVINTHFHRDNLGGNDYLIRKNIPVYGSHLTVKLLQDTTSPDNKLLGLKDNPQRQREYDIFQKTPLVPPNHLFETEDGLLFEAPNDTVEVYHPGPGHSPDNIVVYFKNKNILFGGCLVKCKASQSLGYLGAADLEKWPQSLKNVIQKYPDAKTVVPGHGPPGGLDLIEHTLQLLKMKKQ